MRFIQYNLNSLPLVILSYLLIPFENEILKLITSLTRLFFPDSVCYTFHKNEIRLIRLDINCNSMIAIKNERSVWNNKKPPTDRVSN